MYNIYVTFPHLKTTLELHTGIAYHFSAEEKKFKRDQLKTSVVQGIVGNISL